MLTAMNVDDILNALPGRHIAVVGDFCLDAYWSIDMGRSEESLETGIFTHPVRSQRYSPGGAGNVANNLKAMGVGTVCVFGMIGNDPFGTSMSSILADASVDVSGLLRSPEGWDTPVYIKPIINGVESHRLDFGAFNDLHDAAAGALIASLEHALPRFEVVVVNQQLPAGLHTPFFRSRLNDLMARHPEQMFLVDSRHHADAYRACFHKLNDKEALRLCGRQASESAPVAPADAQAAGRQLFERWSRPLFMTRGAEGALVVDTEGDHILPAVRIAGETDPVGAGDSMLAGVAAALACGSSNPGAACFGNLAAGVTVQKLYQTGTATPAEIRAIAGALHPPA